MSKDSKDTKETTDMLDENELRERRARAAKARMKMDRGPVERQVPPERPGYHQHVCANTPDRIGQMIELGYNHRKVNGKNCLVTDKAGVTQCVMETPNEIWADIQAHKNGKAKAPKDQIAKSRKLFGNSQFNNPGEFSSGSEEFPGK